MDEPIIGNPGVAEMTVRESHRKIAELIWKSKDYELNYMWEIDCTSTLEPYVGESWYQLAEEKGLIRTTGNGGEKRIINVTAIFEMFKAIHPGARHIKCSKEDAPLILALEHSAKIAQLQRTYLTPKIVQEVQLDKDEIRAMGGITNRETRFMHYVCEIAALMIFSSHQQGLVVEQVSPGTPITDMIVSVTKFVVATVVNGFTSRFD